jgi:glyoxylase I family protein
MKITLTSLMVDDQAKALAFYTAVLGFQKKHDIPIGEYRWITVTSPEGHADVELALEPNANPAGRSFQEAMFRQGIPIASFESRDIAAECGPAEDTRRRVHARADADGTRDDCYLR